MRQPNPGARRGRLRAAAPAAIAVLLGLSGCSGAAPSPSPSTRVVATVADRRITQARFDLRLASATALIGQSGGHPASGAAPGAAMVARLRASVMRGLIIDAVIADEAGFHHVEATSSDVDADIAADARAAGGSDALQTQLAESGGSLDQLRDETTSRLNEQHLEDYFARQRAAEAEQALASGTSFATVASQYSDDAPSAAQGGNAGTLTISELNVSDPAFGKGIASLALHQLSATPIRDRSGYDIVQIDAILPTTRMLHRILIAAPDPYTVRQRPAWFSTSIVAAVNDDCGRNAIHLLISDAGPSPCLLASPAPPPAKPSG